MEKCRYLQFPIVITTHYILSGSGIGKTGYVNYDQQVAVQIILGIISAIYREEKNYKAVHDSHQEDKDWERGRRQLTLIIWENVLIRVKIGILLN